MKNKTYKIIHKGNVILRNNMLHLDSSKQQIIEKNWSSEIKKNPKIFNGQVLVFINQNKNINDIIIDVGFTEYKNVLASRKIPELNIKPVGVSAITIIDDLGEKFVLFSTRSKNNTEYPGFIELVPSGHIDKSALQKNNSIDYTQKIKEEFFEETGCNQSCINKVHSLCLIYEMNNRIYDVGCVIELNSSRANLIDSFASVKEYETPEFIRIEELTGFINKNREKLVPTSLGILECFMEASS